MNQIAESTELLRATKAGAPSPAAERMRRVRQRRRNGLRYVRLEIRKSEIAALIRLGHLATEHSSNTGQIAQAFYRYFESNLDR